MIPPTAVGYISTLSVGGLSWLGEAQPDSPSGLGTAAIIAAIFTGLTTLVTAVGGVIKILRDDRVSAKERAELRRLRAEKRRADRDSR